LRIYGSKVMSAFVFNWWELKLSTLSGGRVATSAGFNEIGLEEKTIQVYPSPIQNRFTLLVNSEQSGEMKIQIIGLNGAIQNQFVVIKPQGSYSTILSLSNLPKGEYILMAQMKDWQTSKKIIKL
ncbi:MAG TPA: T9SS type A sorting domain-containing protein, partial [Chitinophagaceae bacterium]